MQLEEQQGVVMPLYMQIHPHPPGTLEYYQQQSEPVAANDGNDRNVYGYNFYKNPLCRK